MTAYAFQRVAEHLTRPVAQVQEVIVELVGDLALAFRLFVGLGGNFIENHVLIGLNIMFRGRVFALRAKDEIFIIVVSVINLRFRSSSTC